MTMIKVAIIEDDAFIKEELVELLNKSKQLECVMSASSGENFFKYFTEQTKLDILLSDIGLPGMSGIEAIIKLKELQPNTQVVVLSSLHDNDTIFKALRAGATGYLLKDTSLEKLEQQLIDVLDGKPPLSPAIASRMIAYFNQSSKKTRTVNLTPKEKEVLNLLIDGYSYKLIAAELAISLNGARYHVKNIYKKLHINARPQLMKLYLKGELGQL